MAKEVATYNQRGRRSGPCRILSGFGKALHIVPTALLVRVQCFRKGMYIDVQGPSAKPTVLAMIKWAKMSSSKAFNYFLPDEMKFAVPFIHLACQLDHRKRPNEWFLLTHILETDISSKFRQKLIVRFKGCSKCLSMLVISITMCRQFWSYLKIFRMEIKNASTTPSKSNQLQIVNTERWESWNVTTQPGEIDYMKSEVMAFGVNACRNVTVKTFIIKCIF